jgi:hypothetical protein
MKRTVDWPTQATQEAMQTCIDLSRGDESTELRVFCRALLPLLPTQAEVDALKPRVEVRWVWVRRDLLGREEFFSTTHEVGKADGALRVEVPVLSKQEKTVTVYLYLDILDHPHATAYIPSDIGSWRLVGQAEITIKEAK